MNDPLTVFFCAQCGGMVESVWNADKARHEPASKYWKGHDISEAYCGAQCSLIKHDSDNSA